MRDQDPDRWEAFKRSVMLCGLQAPILAAELEPGAYTVLAGNDRMRCLEELHAEGHDIAIRIKEVEPEEVSDDRVVVDSLLSNHMRRDSSKSHQAIVVWEQREQLIDQLGGEESFSQLKRKGDRLVDALHRITGVGRTYLAHASVVCGRRHSGLRDAVYNEQLAIQVAAEAASPGRYKSDVIDEALRAMHGAMNGAASAGKSTRQAKQAAKQAFEQTLAPGEVQLSGHTDQNLATHDTDLPLPSDNGIADSENSVSGDLGSSAANQIGQYNVAGELPTSTSAAPLDISPEDCTTTLDELATATDDIGGRLQEVANDVDPSLSVPIKSIAGDLGDCADRIRAFCDPGQCQGTPLPTGDDEPPTNGAVKVEHHVESLVDEEPQELASLLDLQDGDPLAAELDAVDELSFSDEMEFADALEMDS